MKKVSTLVLGLLMTYAFMLGSGNVLAQDGTLDSSFRVPFNGWWGQPWNGGGNTQVARQPDGKLLMTGNLNNPSTPSHKNKWIIRFNTDGSLDQQFENNLPASLAGTRGTGVTLQDDGKIIFCTHSDIQRLNPDGTLDNSYQPDASIKGNIFGSLHLQKDQKLIASRSTAPQVARLNTDGTLDSTFSADFNGRVSEALPLPDGRIIVGGLFTQCNSKNTGSLVVLNADGSLDPSFDFSGGGFKGNIRTVTLDMNGDILVGGFKFQSFNGTTLNNTGIARISMEGVLDADFNSTAGTGPAGYWSNGDYSAPTISAIITASDSTMICVGDYFSYNTNNHAYGIIKLNHDGTIDPSFVSTGFATNTDPSGTTAGGSTHRYAAGGLLESDTSIIVIGTFSGYNGDAEAYNIIRIKNTVKPTAPAATISIDKLDPQPKYCRNSPVAVAYTATGTYNSGNIFTAQLSDANGDFTNATDIGTLTGTATSGTIDALIPGTTAGGSKYRIRVVSSDPAVAGDDNGADLEVNASVDLSLFSIKSTPTPPEICEGEEIILSGQYISSGGGGITRPLFTWDKGVTDNKAFTPDVGTTTYTLTASNGGCSTTRTIQVTVKPGPKVTATAQPDKVCKGEQTVLTEGGNADSYSWDNGVTGGTAFTPGATETYTVTGTAANGCTDTAQVTVTVNPLPTVTATANPGTDICEGNEVTLNGGGADTYSWDKNVTDGKAFVPTQTETYTVIGTDANGCENTTDITVNVKDTSIVAVADTICFGDTYTLGTQTLDKTGTYTEVFVAANGCDSTVNLALTVNTVDVSITQNGNELKATDGATSYQWIDCKDNQPIAGATNQTYRSTEAGDFAVVVTSGDCTDTSVCYHLEGEHAGISGNSFSHQITLYPNPNHGQMTITSGSALANATVRVVNVVGQTVKEINHLSGNSFGLDISAYAAGIYYVEIRDGAQTARVKFTKE